MGTTGHLKILIADDDAAMRLALRDMLANEPTWEVIEAEDGAIAWRLLEERTDIDICVTDIRMPELDGLGLLRKIRSSGFLQRMAVVVCTSARDRQTVEEAAGLSIDSYILKPFQTDLLLSRIRQLVQKRQGPLEVSLDPGRKGDLTGFVQRAGKPPSLLTVYHELTAALKRPDIAMSELSRIILHDPSFTARLLQLANSCFYGGRADVSTIQSATQLVGLDQIEHLVLATTIIESFAQLPRQLADAASFWEHSVACGIASALLGEQLKLPIPERLFIGGLLHEIGRLMIYLEAPSDSRKILLQCERTRQLSCKVEREILGFDHALLGAELISFWRLPKSLADVVGRHHVSVKSAGISTDAYLVHFADFITSALQFGSSGEPYVSPLILPNHLQQLLSSAVEMDTFIDQLENRYQELVPIVLGKEAVSAAAEETSPAPPPTPDLWEAAEASVNERLRHVEIGSPALSALRKRAILRAVNQAAQATR